MKDREYRKLELQCVGLINNRKNKCVTPTLIWKVGGNSDSRSTALSRALPSRDCPALGVTPHLRGDWNIKLFRS